MFLDPIIPALCATAFVVLAIAVVLRRLNQPHVVAYILAGVLVGPGVLGIVGDLEPMSRLGSIGVVLLLFFVGMEVHVPSLIKGWRIAVVGTLLQVALSVGVVWLLGLALGWSLSRSVLLGFVIVHSSTAVVLKLLRDRGEADTEVGRNVLGVTLVQDLALVPMLIVLSLLAGERPSAGQIAIQCAGAVLIVALVAWVVTKQRFPLPLRSIAGTDGESRLIVALLACFGLAWATGAMGLSAALGAFAAGLVLTYSSDGDWVRERLASLRDLLVAVFFVSVGMMIDVTFLVEHWATVAFLVGAVFVANTAINAGVVRLLGMGWRDSLYCGALLAQIGELSFLLAALGLQIGAIGGFGYQATVATIAITLTLSPMWIALFRPKAPQA